VRARGHGADADARSRELEAGHPAHAHPPLIPLCSGGRAYHLLPCSLLHSVSVVRAFWAPRGSCPPKAPERWSGQCR
jgi:hypothetical protein